MERREPKSFAFCSQSINIGSLNLGAKAATVAKSQIIGDDDEKVRAL